MKLSKLFITLLIVLGSPLCGSDYSQPRTTIDSNFLNRLEHYTIDQLEKLAQPITQDYRHAKQDTDAYINYIRAHYNIALAQKYYYEKEKLGQLNPKRAYYSKKITDYINKAKELGLNLDNQMINKIFEQAKSFNPSYAYKYTFNE